MKYKSKIDIYFILTMMIFVVIPIAASIISIYLDLFLIPLVVMFVIIDILLVVPMWMHTAYTFEEDHLKIESGFFVRISIPYQNIISYSRSKGEFSYTALARSGLSVKYKNTFNEISIIYISPHYIGFFLDEMRKNTLLDVSDENKGRFLFFGKRKLHK